MIKSVFRLISYYGHSIYFYIVNSALLFGARQLAKKNDERWCAHNVLDGQRGFCGTHGHVVNTWGDGYNFPPSFFLLNLSRTNNHFPSQFNHHKCFSSKESVFISQFNS